MSGTTNSTPVTLSKVVGTPFYCSFCSKNNEKLTIKRKFFIFNFFHNFVILIDREHQNTHSDQISASLNEKYGFYRQTKENNRNIREQKKNLYF